jgi:hypothetical protein
VVEVTIRGSAVLPDATEYGTSPQGPWAPLFS